MWRKIISLLAVLSLAALMVQCGDFLSGGILDTDPNRPTEVPLLSQLAGVQMATYGFVEGDVGIFTSMWMQHVAGTGHQYSSYEVFEVTSDLFNGPWNQVYQEGGLIDMHDVQKKAKESGANIVSGIAKMYEALVVATAADVWGDIPYSEAADPANRNPHYDKQSDVHNAVLQLIDSAIEDFQAGQENFDGTYDFSFGGNTAKWIQAAHTLKARILLNWAEVKPENYQLALNEAQQGISSYDGNWIAPHSDAQGEQNIYYQFRAQRWYIRVGGYIVDILKEDNDPRLEFYFGPNSNGEYVGSHNGEYNEEASWFNESTFGAPGWDYDLVTWEENQFIKAECQYNLGDEAGALATLNETLAGIEERWADYLGGRSLPRYSNLSGVDLLRAIIREKYKALLLNPQIWNDWKRTGFPELTTFENRKIPRRFLYPDNERTTNANFPGTLGIYHRNENDPGDPPYLGYIP
jgi:hypothetical protein